MPYSDAQLIGFLQKAARRVNSRLHLFGTSEEIVVDSSGSITPEDGNLHDILLLQAECMIASRDFSSDLNSGSAGVLVRDGEQTVDTREASIARGTFYDSPFSPCAELKERLLIEGLDRSDGNLVW